jgi:EAL and modified HD-GYP domain-containing signal transduction protein
MARQPILDKQGRTCAYELLFRNSTHNAFTTSHEHASQSIVDSLMLYGIDKITGGESAFINCTLDILTSNHIDLLPPATTVIEILETIEPTPQLEQICLRLKAAGYRIALDDFLWIPGIEPLVQLADFIKVDFLQSGPAERQTLLRRLQGSSALLLAEKIESQEQFQQAVAEGFTLFQGYFFHRPHLIRNRDIPANIYAQLQILKELSRQPLNFRTVCALVRQDAAITYRILRVANSAAIGLRKQVDSIERALSAIGEDAFRRIAGLAITTALASGRTLETLRIALARARFCELAAQLCDRDPTEQYMLGLFSLLPAMLEIPTTQFVDSIAMRSELRAALMGETNDHSPLLRFAEAWENADWPRCDQILDALGLTPDSAQQCFLDATSWADSVLHAA